MKPRLFGTGTPLRSPRKIIYLLTGLTLKIVHWICWDYVIARVVYVDGFIHHVIGSVHAARQVFAPIREST